MGLPLKMVWKLQLMQNVVVRMIVGGRRFDTVGLLFRWVHGLPICFWAQFRVLVLTFPVQLGPEYLRDCLLLYSPAHPLQQTQ